MGGSVSGFIEGGKYPVNMKADFVVRDGEGEVVLTGDAKWKVGTPSQSDIYQMAAYQLADDVPGLLVYPAQGNIDILPRLKTRESPKGILRLCVSSEFRYAFA